MKYTPGPWRSGGCEVREANGCLICDLAVAKRHSNETEANARLIAAAPEMYAILNRLYETGQYWAEVDNVRAVLAKAREEVV
jgi:hypothetical protein